MAGVPAAVVGRAASTACGGILDSAKDIAGGVVVVVAVACKSRCSRVQGLLVELLAGLLVELV